MLTLRMNKQRTLRLFLMLILVSLTSTTFAEYFLRTHIKEFNTKDYPLIYLKILIEDFEGAETLTYSGICSEFYNPECKYDIELKENNRTVKGLRFRRLERIDNNNDIMEIRYTSENPQNDYHKIDIKVDNGEGIHNGSGDTFIYDSSSKKDNKTPDDMLSPATLIHINSLKEELSRQKSYNAEFEFTLKNQSQNINSIKTSTELLRLENKSKIELLKAQNIKQASELAFLKSHLRLIAQVPTKVQQKHNNQGYTVSHNINNIPFDNWSDDEFWDRAVVLTALESDDSLSQIRVDTSGPIPRFIFLRYFKKGEEKYAQIVEFDTEFHVIEEYSLAELESNAKYGPEGFRSYNFDNMWINGNELIYYSKFSKNSKPLKKYILGSRDAGINIIENEALIKKSITRVSDGAEQQALQSPDKTSVGRVSGSRLSIHTGPGALDLIKTLSGWDTVKDERISSFKVSSFFDIAGITWSSDSKRVYFDNSNISLACIYELDVASQSVTKIVPEHEAVLPYHFTWNNQEYVAYSELNTIRIAKRPIKR